MIAICWAEFWIGDSPPQRKKVPSMSAKSRIATCGDSASLGAFWD